MNEEPRSERRKIREALARVKSALTVGGLALLAVGLLLGFLGSQSFTYLREQAHLKSARQSGESLFNKLTPKAEVQLNFLNDRLDEIRKQAAKGIVATNSGSVAGSGYEVQQKRLDLELEQVDRVLSQLVAFADQAARDFKGRTDLEIFPAAHQRKQVELQARYENTQTGLRLLAAEVSFAKERQLKLALAEAEATQRVQAEALRKAQSEAETAERARAEAVQRVQAEAAQRSQAEVAQRAQAEAAQRSQTEALQRLLEIALLRTQTQSSDCQPVYVQPAVSCANDLLVIGRRYHPAYLGYGYNRFYSSDYYPYHGYSGSRWFY